MWRLFCPLRRRCLCVCPETMRENARKDIRSMLPPSPPPLLLLLVGQRPFILPVSIRSVVFDTRVYGTISGNKKNSSKLIAKNLRINEGRLIGSIVKSLNHSNDTCQSFRPILPALIFASLCTRVLINPSSYLDDGRAFRLLVSQYFLHYIKSIPH